MFTKNGEAIEISRIEEANSCVSTMNPEMLENFSKIATSLKKIAPKAEDFLYFSAVMMHAAEASALNDDGSTKLTKSGEPVVVGWDKNNGTWRWQTNDPSVLAYKNCNGDIFPEEELVKAYKKWIGKPLCIDHKSSSVDHVRGFIVDTYYDRNLKRVIALCALDKFNYPDLARKVSTGYSNSVSMGTAVGRAVCFDCGKVARTEADFCEHMRNKNCYGEINIDLNPLELSIVVNGADPKAHIKHIIAAANTLNSYVETKSLQLNKFAGNFSATIRSDDTSVDIKAESIEDFKKSFESACSNFEKLIEDTNNAAFNQSSGTVAMDDTVLNNTDLGLAPPVSRYASTANVEANLVSELKKVTSSIEAKLNQMKQSLDKLAMTSTKLQEGNMSGSKEINKKGYFQGAGEENEPTPGQPRYAKDPMNEKLRMDGDKQMETEDLGPVDGMHPGPASVNMSELDRKKMLARAVSEDRAMRRNAIVAMAKEALETKKAYFLGGGGENEPTPGKVKYPVDKLNSTLRDNSDKHMVGQKPFPNVGDVDKLHPSPDSADVSDEKKRKEQLHRASLKARFNKVANSDGTQNLGKSGWEVFLGDKLLLSASINELSGNRAGMLYDSFATRAFGIDLMNKIKVLGADKVRAMVKQAQANPMPEMPEMPAPEAAAPVAAPAEVPEMPEAPTAENPQESALDLSEQVRDLSSDLVESVRALSGEKAEMGAEELTQKAPVATASDLGALKALHKELNGSLTTAMKETIAELNANYKELVSIATMYSKGAVTASNKDLVNSIVEDTFKDTKTAISDGMHLMSAFVKYARGTQTIVKRAEIEDELAELSEESQAMKNTDMQPAEDMLALINETDDDLYEVTNLLEENVGEEESNEGDSELEELENLLETLDVEDEDSEESDENSAATIVTKTPQQAIDMSNKVPTDTKFEVKASFDTTTGRAAMRAKLAAEALKTNPCLQAAHPKGKVTTKLDVKPSGDLGIIENLQETHDAMMDVALAPPRVRKEAEAIHQLVSEGKLDPKDLEALVSEGLDKDAVNYYRKYFGQVDGGSEFANELVKEHTKAMMEEKLTEYQVKLARAYELAYDMVDRGMCERTRHAVSNQVSEIMKINDESFNSFKRVIASQQPMYSAGRLPQVGMIDASEFTPSSNEDNLISQLSAALSKTSKKMF
jgi:hypothetical protein